MTQKRCITIYYDATRILMNKQENRQYMNARVQAVVFCKLPSSIKSHKAVVDPAHPIASKLQ